MSGMEMMFSSLIGMKPAEIREAAQKTMALIEGAANDIAEIKASQLRTEEKLDALLEAKETPSGKRKSPSRNQPDNHNVQL